jgi:hypothetical protein
MVTSNAQPYSNHDWHFRINCAHWFGHAAAADTVHTTLKLIDQAGIRGELALRELRTGRVEYVNQWGRPNRCARSSAGSAGSRSSLAVARVVAVFDDLLLGSNVLGMLRAAGHEAQLVGAPANVHPDGAAVLIVDLASGGFDGIGLVEDLRARDELLDTRLLGVYSHVHHDVKSRAEAAGFDLVVPRSRMAREGPALVARLAGDGA